MAEKNVVHYFVGGTERGEWKEASLVPEWLGGTPDLETLRGEITRSGYYAQLGTRGQLPKGNPLTLLRVFSL